MLLDQERNATIIVSEDAKYLVLPFENFEKIKTEHPVIGVKLLEHLGAAVADRFLDQQYDLLDKLLSRANSPQKALADLREFVGEVKVCNRELAKKLFGIIQPEVYV